MKKVKFDPKKFGEGVLGLLQTNSGTIVGGLSMIAMALLCRKLDIPYQVLTDPFASQTNGSYQKTVNQTRLQPSIMLVPNNSIEASIAAIASGAHNASFDSQRARSADEILKILRARKADISESTATYAITTLQGISSRMDFDSGRNYINSLIGKIGRGEY